MLRAKAHVMVAGVEGEAGFLRIASGGFYLVLIRCENEWKKSASNGPLYFFPCSLCSAGSLSRPSPVSPKD
jgi:hypothetical protein